MLDVKKSKKMIYTKKGFSLIELLVVITIVGILSTVVLTNLNQSRARSYDSKIKQQLIGFRTSASLYYYNQIPNSYGTANDCSSGIFVDNTPANGRPGTYIASNNLPSYAQVLCLANDQEYAIKVSLYSGEEYFCIDSKGAGKTILGPIGSAVSVCP
jgi:prepilin-type N-terminal cleavage/methylation domain-containing protein